MTLFTMKGKVLFLILVFCLVTMNTVFAQETETIGDAFKSGKISGAIGSYYEFVKRDAEHTDDGWSTAYLTLKYETLSWKQLKMGARFFAHGQLYSDDEAGATEPFEVDVESPYTVPELYLDYAFAQKSHITVGRWDHLKDTHIDDNQSEGAYVQVKEIENLELMAGVMRRFAEIDYDDGEDFGRINNAQDLDAEATYGAGSGQELYFLEGKYRAAELLNFNPYLMYHNDYASVYGLDTKIEKKGEEGGWTYGSDVDYYHVDADIAGRGDANNYMISPFVDKKPVYFSVGYARFDDGNALTKPAWLRDYFLPVDQVATYGTPDSEVLFGKLKLTFGDFWTHVVVADTDYQTTAGLGDGSQEYEWQCGYKFFKSLDWNIRLFDVQFDNVDNRDYQKVESHLVYKF